MEIVNPDDNMFHIVVSLFGIEFTTNHFDEYIECINPLSIREMKRILDVYYIPQKNKQLVYSQIVTTITLYVQGVMSWFLHTQDGTLQNYDVTKLTDFISINFEILKDYSTRPPIINIIIGYAILCSKNYIYYDFAQNMIIQMAAKYSEHNRFIILMLMDSILKSKH